MEYETVLSLSFQKIITDFKEGKLGIFLLEFDISSFFIKFRNLKSDMKV